MNEQPFGEGKAAKRIISTFSGFVSFSKPNDIESVGINLHASFDSLSADS